MKDAESEAFRKAHDEAAEWVVKKSSGLNEYEEEVFKRWLERDPLHRDRMAAHQRIWDDTELLKDLFSRSDGEGGDPAKLERFPTPKRRAWWGRRAALAVAAAACVALGVTSLRLQDGSVDPSQPFERAYAAEALERHFLPDGSLVEMKAGAQVLVRYEDAVRNISLERGEAHFSVVKDSGRPFVVEARGAKFRAVGTAFSVSLQDVEVTLLVTEGEVRMTAPPRAETLELPQSGAAFEQDLTARKQATVRLDDPEGEPLIQEVADEELDRALVWKREVLDFEATPLSQAIAEFNARNRDQMRLASASIGAIAIDGSFRSDNLLAFVRLIEVSAGVKARQGEDGLITLYR